MNGVMGSLNDLNEELEAESACHLGLGVRPSNGEPGCSLLFVFVSKVEGVEVDGVVGKTVEGFFEHAVLAIRKEWSISRNQRDGKYHQHK